MWVVWILCRPPPTGMKAKRWFALPAPQVYWMIGALFAWLPRWTSRHLLANVLIVPSRGSMVELSAAWTPAGRAVAAAAETATVDRQRRTFARTRMLVLLVPKLNPLVRLATYEYEKRRIVGVHPFALPSLRTEDRSAQPVGDPLLWAQRGVGVRELLGRRALRSRFRPALVSPASPRRSTSARVGLRPPRLLRPVAGRPWAAGPAPAGLTRSAPRRRRGRKLPGCPACVVPAVRDRDDGDPGRGEFRGPGQRAVGLGQ